MTNIVGEDAKVCILARFFINNQNTLTYLYFILYQ